MSKNDFKTIKVRAVFKDTNPISGKVKTTYSTIIYLRKREDVISFIQTYMYEDFEVKQ
jgi:hypothetical protein